MCEVNLPCNRLKSGMHIFTTRRSTTLNDFIYFFKKKLIFVIVKAFAFTFYLLKIINVWCIDTQRIRKIDFNSVISRWDNILS